jgi:hypothetical protein
MKREVVKSLDEIVVVVVVSGLERRFRFRIDI